MIKRLADDRWEVRLRADLAAEFDDAGDAEAAHRRGRAALAALRTDLGRVGVSCTLTDRTDEFLDALRLGLWRGVACAEATVACHRRRLARFARAWPGRPLDLITRADVERWTAERLKRVNRHTVRLDLGTLRAFAHWAAAEGHAPEATWCRSIPTLPARGRVLGNNAPPRFLSRGALRLLLSALDDVRPDLACFLRAMAYFGLRPEAVARLTLADAVAPAEGDDGWMRVPGLKGGSPRQVPVREGSRAAAWLARCGELRRRWYGERATASDRPLVPARPSGWDDGAGDEANRARVDRLRPRARIRPGGWTTARLDQQMKRTLRGLDRPELDAERITPYVVRHSVMQWFANQPHLSSGHRQRWAGHKRATTQEYYLDFAGAGDRSVYDAAQRVEDFDV